MEPDRCYLPRVCRLVVVLNRVEPTRGMTPIAHCHPRLLPGCLILWDNPKADYESALKAHHSHQNLVKSCFKSAPSVPCCCLLPHLVVVLNRVEPNQYRHQSTIMRLVRTSVVPKIDSHIEGTPRQQMAKLGTILDRKRWAQSNTNTFSDVGSPTWCRVGT